jgi:stage IV sporulation protein FB
MNDPLTWAPINLGRWAGTSVRIHIFLILFTVFTLLNAAIIPPHHVAATAMWLLMLLLALAVHEAGHALMAAWLGCDPEEVRLWPLGNLVGPSGKPGAGDNILVAVAGWAASALMVVAAAVALRFLDAQFVWWPFGNVGDSGGAPTVAVLAADGQSIEHRVATQFTRAWCIGWFGYLNWVIMLANLLPALPFDGGRVSRAYLAQTSIAPGRDGLIPPILARSFALILVIGGLFRVLLAGHADGLTLILLAVLIEWMVRLEARMMEDGGFFDDGVFGYDFSEGYTSLDAGTAKVRPYRESALRRWRRRRSELRRHRRAAREAAEERRMDEILEKLHREGRAALTDEEHRFLVRVSAKYRNRPRASD